MKWAKLLIIAVLGLGLIWVASNIYLTRDKTVSLSAKNLSKDTVSLEAVSFISPHHLVAKDLIEEVFEKFSSLNKGKKIERVIILSPNHFHKGHGWAMIPENERWITADNSNWDKDMVELLSQEKDIFQKSNQIFLGEHGIESIVPFVRKYFSSAQVLPIMIRDGLPAEKAKRIAEILAEKSEGKTILILSADFSHYIGQTASAMHDQKSIETISNFNWENFSNLDIDCVGGLKILVDFSHRLGYSKFNLLENSSSSQIAGKDLGSDNTSYVTGYYSYGDLEEKEKSANLLFLGNFLSDGPSEIASKEKEIGWPARKIERIFWSQDLNITDLPGLNNMVFEKAKEVKEYSQKINIRYFNNLSEDNSYLIENIQGKKIAFVRYDESNCSSLEQSIRNIQIVRRDVDFVIVYCYWGERSSLQESINQKNAGRKLIDKGADIIIGTYPQAVQPVEIYKNKPIFYSLGNLSSDQSFNEKTRNLLAVGVVLSREKMEFYLIPLYMEKDGQISLSTGEVKEKLLKRILSQENIENLPRDAIMDTSRFELYLNK